MQSGSLHSDAEMRRALILHSFRLSRNDAIRPLYRRDVSPLRLGWCIITSPPAIRGQACKRLLRPACIIREFNIEARPSVFLTEAISFCDPIGVALIGLALLLHGWKCGTLRSTAAAFVYCI